MVNKPFANVLKMSYEPLKSYSQFYAAYFLSTAAIKCIYILKYLIKYFIIVEGEHNSHT